MPLSQTPHRTPLKRVSQGSLFRLSRSGAYPDAPYGLGFIEPALAEFVDETEALQTNVEGLSNLSESLATFNESFASWLYVMNMNALTTDWPQAPTSDSYALAKRRAGKIPPLAYSRRCMIVASEEKTIAAAEALERQAAEVATREAELLADKTAATETTEADVTMAGNTTGASGLSGINAGVGKKVLKPKMTTKERKERDKEIDRIISALPLEFRGSDPTLRRHMEMVIEGVLKARDQTVKLPDLIKMPDLNQARVNKCLIALVNRKVVQKDSTS
ncbi:DASH complex subunit dam1, partial [Leucoagaricus gongylophorus]